MSKIDTDLKDDFLYSWLLDLLQQVKLVQGSTALNSTLRRHATIKNYLIAKQIDKLNYFEERYFLPDGSLNREAIDSFYTKFEGLRKS